MFDDSLLQFCVTFVQTDPTRLNFISIYRVVVCQYEIMCSWILLCSVFVGHQFIILFSVLEGIVLLLFSLSLSFASFHFNPWCTHSFLCYCRPRPFNLLKGRQKTTFYNIVFLLTGFVKIVSSEFMYKIDGESRVPRWCWTITLVSIYFPIIAGFFAITS